MESMESLKRRVHTAEDLHSLVRTMKALAAVNIRQLEHAVESLDEFSRTVELGLRVVLQQPGRSVHTSSSGTQPRTGFIVFGSDQGMCGPLNDQIVNDALAKLAANSEPPENRIALAVVERVGARLEDAGEHLETTLPVACSTSGITSIVQEILFRTDHWHSEQRIERILVFFCEHVSRATYHPRSLQLLPIDQDWLDRLAKTPWPTNMVPSFSMDEDLLLSSLVRQYLFVTLFRACAESLASENASRLAAMRGAERNIGERISELKGKFHQTRQMAITEELLDIVAGFEALKD